MAQRNTVQQKIIAGQLAKLHGSHPTADEVYRSMKDEYPSISRATVYRTLNKMSDNGQALKVRVSSGADHFDDTLRPHYHVVCAKCGRVDDVEVDLPSSVTESLDKATAPGFTITGYELLFCGLCSACAQERQE